MNLFNLFAKLTLDNSEYEAKMKDSQKTASSFSSKIGVAMKTGARAVAAFGTAVVAASALVAKLAINAIDYGSQIDDNAQKIGFSTEAYQFWSLVLERAGSNAEQLNMAIRNMTTFTQNLADGQGEALLTLQKLGIGYEEFMAMTPEEQFYTLIDALQGMTDETEKTQIAQEIFGNRVYQELLPLLGMEQGSLEDLHKEFEDLGLIMSDDTIKAMAAVGDKLDNLKNTFKVAAATIGADLLPEISLLIDGLTGLAQGSDDAMQMLSDGLVGLISKVSQSLPTIISVAGDLLSEIIVGLGKVLSNPELINSLVDVVEALLFKVVEIIPTLTQSIADIAVALFDALLHLDWGTLIINLTEVLLDIVLVQLPTMLTEMLYSLIEAVFDLFFTQDGQKALAEFGITLAETIINSLIAGVESGVNLLVDGINGLLDGISGIWTWIGIPAIPDVPHASFPRVDFADGGMFPSNMGTLYALAGEAGAEIVARGARGTGVANIEQIADAQYMAMTDYGLNETINQAAANIVNGIVLGLRMSGTGAANGDIIVKIGEKDFNSYIVQTVNNSLKAQGRKTLNTVTAY